MTTEYQIQQQVTTVGQALDFTAAALQRSDVFFGHGTDNAWDEAVQMVLAVAELPLDADDGVLPRHFGDSEVCRLNDLLQSRIERRIPLPYLLGRAWFAGLEFLCDERAIIPRSPIAELIEQDFRPWYSGPKPSRLLDLCCGGGCIGLAAAWYSPDLAVDLVDIDPGALALGRENTARMGLTSRVRSYQSDCFSKVDGTRYDIIVSNPPYVDAADLAAMPAEYQAEPQLALGSGSDGLHLTRIILAQAQQYLKPEGLLLVEVGNSWEALEEYYAGVPFTWLEFEHGGHGVFALTAKELQSYSASFTG